MYGAWSSFVLAACELFAFDASEVSSGGGTGGRTARILRRFGDFFVGAGAPTRIAAGKPRDTFFDRFFEPGLPTAVEELGSGVGVGKGRFGRPALLGPTAETLADTNEWSLMGAGVGVGEL